MKHSWLNNIDTQLIEYLNSLRKLEKSYEYYPAKKGTTQNGKNLSLGLSCYAIKILFTLNRWDEIEKSKRSGWVDYINSFQKNIKSLPSNSYIDNEIYNFYNNPSIKSSFKDKTKITLNLIANQEYKINKVAFQESIRAETKQAISTLFQIGEKNKLPYKDFPIEESQIFSFLNSLNWKNPWSAGGQAAAIAVFSKTQLSEEKLDTSILNLYKFLGKISDKDNGLYYKGKLPHKGEAINGAMKVITALDWMGKEIHYPKKLIDFCLSTKPSSHGCDLVDIVYVLYKSLLQVDYKRKEIIDYMDDIIKLIYLHYKRDEGGFSYSIDKSQEYYYGLKITNGGNNADLHGTILLTWALSMIFNITENNKFRWRIIKP